MWWVSIVWDIGIDGGPSQNMYKDARINLLW
jgi:hypothetical protein